MDHELVEVPIAAEMTEAESKAWDALGRYKFMMFGYWAAIWVHLNRMGKHRHANPWRRLVFFARDREAALLKGPGPEVVVQALDVLEDIHKAWTVQGAEFAWPGDPLSPTAFLKESDEFTAGQRVIQALRKAGRMQRTEHALNPERSER